MDNKKYQTLNSAGWLQLWRIYSIFFQSNCKKTSTRYERVHGSV